MEVHPAYQITGKPVANLDEAIAELASFAAKDKAAITVRRGDHATPSEVAIRRMPEETPSDLPPAPAEPAPAADSNAKTGIVPIRIPESANKCIAYVPENYNPQIPCGVVIWLHPPGT